MNDLTLHLTLEEAAWLTVAINRERAALRHMQRPHRLADSLAVKVERALRSERHPVGAAIEA